ncbi:MAG: HAD family hydrolase [Candidatus Nanoarchaeia archaeon]|nr:HAD family hydrolase [Candidatus Nanoarchaeia archaeon]
MKKLICFDLDNTLINSDVSHFFTYNKAIKHYGFRSVSFLKFLSLMGMPKEQMVREMVGQGKDEEIYYKINKLQFKLITTKYKFFTWRLFGAKKALKKLKKNYKLAVTSNCAHKTIINLLKNAGIDYKLFDAIVGDDDVKVPKPSPNEIKKAVRITKTKASYVVGDSIYDIMAAKRAKVKIISVLTGHTSRKVLKEKKPDYIIKSVRYLPKLLEMINNEP